MSEQDIEDITVPTTPVYISKLTREQIAKDLLVGMVAGGMSSGSVSAQFPMSETVCEQLVDSATALADRLILRLEQKP